MRANRWKPVLLGAVSLLLLCVSEAHAQSLPTGWSDQDVGQVGVAGSASFTNGAFTVKGAGYNMTSGMTDGFHFVYQQLSGDGTIVARVVSVSNSYAQAGVMIRETMTSGATNMITLDSPPGGYL